MTKSEIAIRSPKTALLAIGGALLGVSAACVGACLFGSVLHSSESFRWGEAEREGKLVKYEIYLQDFPDGAHEAEAGQRADQLRQELRTGIADDPAAACENCLLVLHELNGGDPERVKVYLGLLREILIAKRTADADEEQSVLELALDDMLRLPRPRLRLSQRDNSAAERRGEYNTLYAAGFLRELRAVEIVTRNNFDPAAGAGEHEVAIHIDFSVSQTGPYRGGNSTRDLPRMRNISAKLAYYPPGARNPTVERDVSYHAADSYTLEGRPADYQAEEKVWEMAVRSVENQLARELSLKTIVQEASAKSQPAGARSNGAGL